MHTLKRPMNQRAGVLRLGALFATSALLAACAGTGSAPEAQNTTVYFVRHADPNLKDPDRPLNEKGRARAERLVAHFAGVPVTHVSA
jgi:ABC-type oligopeptide transport system substrate-binding subunit